MKTLEDFLRTQEGGNLLDIACGSGSFTHRLIDSLKSYISVTGLDIKPTLQTDFLKNVDGHDVTFVASAVADYLENAGSFDTISISNAIHHLEGVGDILGDLRNILNFGGTVIINEMYSDDLTPAQETQRDLHGLMAKLQCVMGEYHRGAFTRGEIHDFINNAGLIVQHTFTVRKDDAPVQKETDGTDGPTSRVQETIDKAYPDGAPSAVCQELDQLKIRATEIGSAPPPQLTLVCKFK
ncbi:MAG: methyltransferase domain-containing protein [Candidatus Latescibacteria bacterium]|jgi:cyclopropane fatty-acyl-phospholipid synthase-like methyltransferase|nr:methyltransferase domain-containing protein [Candidatus Latescibacterota bacterium]